MRCSTGVIPGGVVTVVSVQPIGDDAVTLYYRDGEGKLGERMLFRSDEDTISVVEKGRPWSLDADPDDFKLAAEAYRIHLAHLFDPLMAVHTSAVEPLPHQITAVYDVMLPRQPLRFLLADDPWCRENHHRRAPNPGAYGAGRLEEVPDRGYRLLGGTVLGGAGPPVRDLLAGKWWS